MSRGVVLAGVAAAALLLVVPVPASFVDQVYADRLYPRWAAAIVPLASAVPFALFDPLVVGFLLLGVAAARRGLARRPAASRAARAAAALFHVVAAAAFVYLWFVAAWGLNYQRTPLAARLDYDRRRVTPASARALAVQTVAELNRLHPLAWASPWPDLPELAARLRPARDAAAPALGLPAATGGGRPKRSLLQPYFRWAGIDGLTNPFLLEVIVNAEALPTERAFIVAHEWGHLAGLAHEAEAGFAGWRTCLAADDQARYSAWLAVYGPVVAALPAADRAQVVAALDDGPRRDLRAIDARYARTLPVVRGVAWSAYDQYFRSQRVPEGLASYDAVVDLILGVRPPG